MKILDERTLLLRGAAALLALCTLALLGAQVRAEDDRVGSETCAVCHEELLETIRSSPHGLADAEGACENCHGPGAAHADSGEAADIRRFDESVAPRERSAACAECHGRQRELSKFRKSEHALGGLACNDCHQVHGNDELLLSEMPPGLCYGCHASVEAQFELNERHPVNEGAVSCTDCHNPHAPQKRSLLGGFKQGVCLDCHVQYRGPWIFEHEAVTVEGCLSCHTPHGSVNRHLLTYQRAGDLCLQCHAEQPFFHDLTDAAGARTTGINDCTRCHSEIHGSNNDALFLN